MKKVSIIFPIYNEGQSIVKTINQVSDFSKKNPNYNFIFVNDGSTDNSEQIILDEIKKSKNKKIKLLSYQKNKGKGYAIKRGVEKSEGDYVCFTDSDLAYSLDDFHIICEKLKIYDMVLAHRYSSDNAEKIKPVRVVFGTVFNLFSRILLNLNFKDMQAGLKGFKKEVAKDLFSKQTINGFAFDTEIIYIASKNKCRIFELPVTLSNPETYNNSKVNLIKDSIKMFISLLKIKTNNFFGKYG